MGPPLEHGGMMPRTPRLTKADRPSMGPPLEHGGMLHFEVDGHGKEALPSMGPPLEHGGMELLNSVKRQQHQASMGPPLEHGGMCLAFSTTL